VYNSDVKTNPAVIGVPMRVGAGESLKADLQFPIGVVSGSPESKKFYDYVFSDPAKSALTDAGFELP
jgi:ABC-type molybdate transport system substrate-binding protein